MQSTSQRIEKFFSAVGLMVCTAVMAALVFELLCWLAWSAYHHFRPGLYAPRIESPAYGDAAWLQDLDKEDSQRTSRLEQYAPFRVWSSREYHGKYVNVDLTATGIWRRTLNPLSTDCQNQRPTTVWVFGGSAVFGTAIPDFETMPSHLSQILNQGGHGCFSVANFGVEGYVVTQEMILLTEQLKYGSRPDIVIFNDGFNDAMAGMSAASPRLTHLSEEMIGDRVEGKLSGRFDFINRLYSAKVLRTMESRFRRSQGVGGPVSNDHVAAVVDNYESTLQVVAALSREYGFRFYSFLQPTLLYGSKPLVPFEQQVFKLNSKEAGSVKAGHALAVYEEVIRRATGDSAPISLANLFDTHSEPLYLDEVHLGPKANELVADAIGRYLNDHPAGVGAVVH